MNDLSRECSKASVSKLGVFKVLGRQKLEKEKERERETAESESNRYGGDSEISPIKQKQRDPKIKLITEQSR